MFNVKEILLETKLQQTSTKKWVDLTFNLALNMFINHVLTQFSNIYLYGP